MKTTPLVAPVAAPDPGASLRVFAASLVIGSAYFVASRGVENFFPFTVLDMYANHIGGTPSRILAVDARGEAHEVDAFVGWRCAGSLQGDVGVCPAAPDFQRLGYVDRSALDTVRAHPGDGNEEPVRLVRRVWRLGEQPGPPSRVDCPISECRAVRR
ncbi:MAG: hypothetical protein U0325_18465 [Polyangiales bacterium]